jgi:hypothetical protein
MGPVDEMLPTAGFAPCFPVTDLRVTLDHYRRLGFDVMDWLRSRYLVAYIGLFAAPAQPVR